MVTWKTDEQREQQAQRPGGRVFPEHLGSRKEACVAEDQ